MPPATAVPLPAFRQPLGLDDPLPTVPGPTSNLPATEEPPARQLQEMDAESQPAPLPPILEPPAAARTRTSSAGDPKAAAKFVYGLLAIIAGTAGALLARNGRNLRQPTPAQLTDVSEPLGAILARHLPTEAIHGSLIDATGAAAAAHAYVLDGPLITTIPTATISYPEDNS